MTCEVITKDKSGRLLHSRTITVEDRDDLERQLEKYGALVTDYVPAITETTAGDLIVTWTKKS